jgi:hypothetical protein
MAASPDFVENGSRPEVLVVVSAPWLGIARFPRLLQEAGCRVVLLCRRGRFADLSRYVDERIDAPGEASDMLPVLQKLLAQRSFAWVVLGDDPILRAAIAKPGAWQQGWFPVDPGSDLPPLLVSKAAFVWAMERARMPMPRTEVVHADEVADAARRMGFPVMVKLDQGSAGDGVFRASNEASLAGLTSKGPIVVQRFAPGRIGSTVVLYSKGRPLCWMSSYKEEVYPRPFGPSTVRRYVSLPAIEPHLERLGEFLKITGICGIDWVESDGEPVFLELNARPTAWLHLYQRYGVDFPAAIHGMLYGTPQVFHPPDAVAEPLVRLFPQDAYRLASDRDWSGFAREFMNGDEALREDPALRRAYQKYLLQRAWSCWLKKAA